MIAKPDIPPKKIKECANVVASVKILKEKHKWASVQSNPEPYCAKCSDKPTNQFQMCDCCKVKSHNIKATGIMSNLDSKHARSVIRQISES